MCYENVCCEGICVVRVLVLGGYCVLWYLEGHEEVGVEVRQMLVQRVHARGGGIGQDM